MDKIQSFEQLQVWQETQNLAVNIYEITRKFPREEQFGLTNQITRASSSVSANIAEGFGRNGIKDKLQFYAIAYGSLLETKNFVYLARKLSYINTEQESALINQVTVCQKLLNAYAKGHRS
jgi:four helix bundle protein